MKRRNIMNKECEMGLRCKLFTANSTWWLSCEPLAFYLKREIRPAEEIFIQESLRWKYAWLSHININNMSKQADNKKNVLQILRIRGKKWIDRGIRRHYCVYPFNPRQGATHWGNDMKSLPENSQTLFY